MLRFELTTQLYRLRTVIALACVAGVPAAIASADRDWGILRYLYVAPVTRTMAAGGYTVLCMLAIAAIAFTLGLLLPRGAEAVAIGLVVVATILNGGVALRRRDPAA